MELPQQAINKYLKFVIGQRSFILNINPNFPISGKSGACRNEFDVSRMYQFYSFVRSFENRCQPRRAASCGVCADLLSECAGAHHIALSKPADHRMTNRGFVSVTQCRLS
jgi:hypothetical protein